MNEASRPNASDGSTGSIQVARDHGVVTATITWERKKNALSTSMLEDLLDVLRDVERSPEDRVLVLTGAGSDFCSGADLSSALVTQVHPLEHMRRVATFAWELHNLSKPTIAKVRGVAIGAGCNIALGCDLVVASDDCRLSEIFSLRGLSLDLGGSWLLPRMIGLHHAKEIALLGNMLTASDAARIGLVNRVLPDAELDAFVDQWASTLAAGPPVALSMTKKLLNASFQVSMTQALEDEARAFTVNLATADSVEAMAAYRDKRPPNYSGRSLLGDQDQ